MMLRKIGCQVCGCFGIAFLLLLYAAGTAIAQAGTNPEPAQVTVVLSEQEGPYLDFSKALDRMLSRKYSHLSIVGSSAPIPDSGLVIAVGMKAAETVADSDAPSVLNVLVTKSGFQELLRDHPERAHARAFSAIYLDQPLRRQVQLIAAALPGKHTVGILYSSPPANLSLLRQLLEQKGLALQSAEVGPSNPLPVTLQDILNHSDVLLALPDAAIYNGSTIRNILLASYRKGIPLVGFSPGYVNAGALCAVVSTPEQIARQVAELIVRYAETQTLPPPQYPDEFEVLLNEQVANSLGFRPRSAAMLHDMINEQESREAP